MEVKLAGFNVPVEIINKIKNNKLKDYEIKALTPETISAAYARISRSPKSVDELVVEAIEDIPAARRSVTNILGMGHHSIADHAIFNFNITDASRLAMEFIEERRLAGYTEKSQRYVTLDGDYIRPKEFSAEDLKKFEELIKIQNEFYFNVNEILFEHLKEKHKKEIEKIKDDKEKKQFIKFLEGRAKEDARYSLSLATKTQLGCSYTGQTLEHAIRVNKYAPLAEQREFAEKLFKEVVEVAPSLIQLADEKLFKELTGNELEEDNFKYTRENLKKLVEETFNKYKNKQRSKIDNIVFYTSLNATLVRSDDFDLNIIAAILHRNSKKDLIECYNTANLLIKEKKAKDFIKEALKYISKHDKLPREFEVSGLIYELIVSSSCFAQLKRHRMNTLLAQDYDPELGIVVPPSIEEIGKGEYLKEVCKKSSELYYELLPKYGKAAEYCLTNAHKRRVIVSTNLRQYYHISRTREDEHAQWEIRSLIKGASGLTKLAVHTTTILLAGKHEFDKIRKNVYGETIHNS